MTTVIPFSRYNEEFSSLVSQTRQTLSAITTILENQHDPESQPSSSPTSSSEESKNVQQKLNLAQQLLNQTKDLLKQMTIEARSLKSSSSSEKDIEECKKILHIAKANHANLKDDVQAIQTKVQHYLLLQSDSSNNGNKRGRRKNGVNSEIKQHLLSTNESISKQNANLERSKQIMADTEMVAMEITEELGRNRETIQSAHSRVRGVNSLSNHARRILVNMTRRETQQKMAVYAVGVILFLALLFLLGFF